MNDSRMRLLSESMSSAGFNRRTFGWNRRDPEMLAKIIIRHSAWGPAIHLDIHVTILALLDGERPARALPQIAGRLNSCIDSPRALEEALSGEGNSADDLKELLDREVEPFLSELSLATLAADDAADLRSGLLINPDAQRFLQELARSHGPQGATEPSSSA